MNRISLQGILAMVSRRALLQLHKPHRAKEYVYSRAVFFKLARDFTRHSFKEIGEIVHKDHASVMHGMKVYDSLVFNKDLKYLKIYNECEKILLSIKEDRELRNPADLFSEEEEEVEYWRARYERMSIMFVEKSEELKRYKEKYSKSKSKLEKIS
jgi:hypothetical protein